MRKAAFKVSKKVQYYGAAVGLLHSLMLKGRLSVGNSLWKSHVRVENYSPLGVVSHPNQQILGHCADSSRFAECSSYSRIFGGRFFGGFWRAAADSHEPAGYSTSWNLRVKQQARNTGLADMEHADHDITRGVRKTAFPRQVLMH